MQPIRFHKPRLLILSVVVCICGWQLSAQTIPIDWSTEKLQLNDGTVLADVSLQSINPSSGRISLLAGRQLHIIALEALPDTLQDTIDHHVRLHLSGAEGAASGITRNQDQASTSSRALPNRRDPNDRNREILLRRFQQTSLAIIREHALRYYEYEHTINGRNVSVFSDTLQLHASFEQLPDSGALRLHVSGSVTIQPAGSDPANPQLRTAQFHAVTNAVNNQPPELLSFIDVSVLKK